LKAIKEPNASRKEAEARELPRKSLVRGLTLMAFIVASVFAARNLARWPACLRYPGELDNAEGRALAEMVHLRTGISIYARPSAGKFDAAIYGPMYYLLGARLVNPERPSYYPLRVVSMLATLGCAAGCALLAFRLSRSGLAAALAPILFLGFGHVAFISLSARSDMGALLLAFSGFLVAHRFQHSRMILFACPLFVLALFYKQQFVAAPLAILLFLIAEKRYRLAAEFTAFLSMAAVALTALFQFVVFRGQAFATHLIVYNLLPFSLRGFLIFLALFSVTVAPLLLAGIETLRLRRDKLVGWYLGCAVCLALLMLAKQGSAVNYFVETILVLSPLLAVLAAHRAGNAQVPGAVELLLLVGIVLSIGEWKVAHPSPRPEDFAHDRVLQAFLRREVPAGASALGEYTGDLTRAGLATPISDLYQYSWLVCRGRLSDTDLVTQIRLQRFAVIMLAADLRIEREAHSGFLCLAEPVHRAVLQSYQLERVFPSPFRYESSSYYAWVPVRGRGTR